MGWMDESIWAWGLMMAYTCAFSMKQSPTSYASREMSADSSGALLGRVGRY